MHLPDGVLSARVSSALAAVGVAGFALAARGTRKSERSASLPTLGFLAAAILVLQLLNFPLIGPTSAHLTGTAMLVSVVGFDAAVLVMAPVLVVQAFIFHDGGLVALGANYVNIALVPAVVSSAVLTLFGSNAREVPPSALAAGTAALAATITGALACAIDLVWSHVLPPGPVLWWMVAAQCVTGFVEAILTAACMLHLRRRRSSLVGRGFPSESSWKSAAPWVAVLLLAALLVPIASTRPDPLEHALRFASEIASRR